MTFITQIHLYLNVAYEQVVKPQKTHKFIWWANGDSSKVLPM